MGVCEYDNSKMQLAKGMKFVYCPISQLCICIKIWAKSVNWIPCVHLCVFVNIITPKHNAL